MKRQHQTVVSLLLLGSAAYATALAGRFQFDDFHLIVNNPEMSGVSAAWHALPISLRPLTKLTLALNVSWHGLRPVGFHLVNVGLHLCSGIILFRIAGTIHGWRSSDVSPAWLAAAIFLLHPAQTDAVTYISGRSTTLMTACLLLAHWLALGARPEARHALAWRCASLVAFLAAVLSKETALVYPLLYLTWLVVLEDRPWPRALAGAAPYAALSVVVFVGLLVHPRYHPLIVDAASRLPWQDAALSHAGAVVALLGVLIGPWRVNIDHALPTAHSLDDVWPQVLGLLAVILFVAWSARHSRVVPGGALWGFAALLPTQSVLVREDLIADRMLYLPMAGFALAFVGLLTHVGAAVLRRWPRAGPVGAPIALAMVLTLGVSTASRNLVYGSEAALWQDSVAKAPHNARAHHNLGYAYELAGDLQPAVREYRIAVALEPENARYRDSLSIGLDKLTARDTDAGRVPSDPAPGRSTAQDPP